MHTLNRILTVLLLLVVLVPPATFALISLDEKTVVQESLQQAIDTAANRYQQRTGVEGLHRRSEAEKEALSRELSPLNEQRAALRAEVVRLRRILRTIGEKHDVTLVTAAQTDLLIQSAKARLSRMLKEQYLRHIGDSPSEVGGVLLRAVMHGAAHDPVVQVSADSMTYLRDLVAARKVFDRLADVEEEREEALVAYRAAQAAYDRAEATAARSAAQLDQIKRIMAEVHEQVLKIQGELARIDARIKRRAERDLIEKGLLDPKAGGTAIASGTPRFGWPVYGRISAGFLSPGYKEFFGVPHYAIDIVVGENTPVAVSTDGVVFLVRDGGATGYTYVLIGHRDGYATLYGHLLSTAVIAGQDVDAGQIIGMSGGQPGTRGAGPMTTGPHLHFEVIKGGVHIDPRSVLP